MLKMYGVAYRTVSPPQKGYRNTSFAIDNTYNIILYKNEASMLARIARTNRIGNFTAQHGLPARQTHDLRIIQINAGSQQRYAALYNYLPGVTIPWEAYTMHRLKALGKTMSQLHAVLQTYNAHDLPAAALENLSLNQRMLRYFADKNVSKALRQKLGLAVVHADYQKLLRACNRLPRQQALHMDFVRGNILFSGNSVTGILDFEKAAYGHPLFDIARTFAFLLVDCKYKTPEKIYKYFLRSGYHKHGQAKLPLTTIGHYDLLAELTNFFLLHDFYKFLRHNPYESLAENEHFIRTKSMLLKRGLITHTR